MKIFIFCIIVLLFSSVAPADTVGSENDQGNSADLNEISPQTKEEKKQTKKEQPNWPRPYAPSEKISADSSVPFPADI